MQWEQLHLAGQDTTAIIVSDHGFHPDHLCLRMRAIGGMAILTDASNPRAYFEYEPVKDLAGERRWLGKAVKVVARLLPNLPTCKHCRVLFMERPLTEVVAS